MWQNRVFLLAGLLAAVLLSVDRGALGRRPQHV